MARPTKWRKIECEPRVPYFIPSQEMKEEETANVLLLEELEAIRLKDLEGYEQAECAERMEVSRPTFQRILLSAREKVADSIVHGKAIHIEGGTYTRNICDVVCDHCHREWKERMEDFQLDSELKHGCPNCGSKEIHCNHSCKGTGCKKIGCNHHCRRS